MIVITLKEMALWFVNLISKYRAPILFVLCVVGLAIFLYLNDG